MRRALVDALAVHSIHPAAKAALTALAEAGNTVADNICTNFCRDPWQHVKIRSPMYTKNVSTIPTECYRVSQGICLSDFFGGPGWCVVEDPDGFVQRAARLALTESGDLQ